MIVLFQKFKGGQDKSFWKPERLVGFAQKLGDPEGAEIQDEPLVFNEALYEKLISDIVYFCREKIFSEDFIGLRQYLYFDDPSASLEKKSALTDVPEQQKRLDPLLQVVAFIVENEFAQKFASIVELFPDFSDRFRKLIRRTAKIIIFGFDDQQLRSLNVENACEEFRDGMQGILNASKSAVYHEKWGEFGALNKRAFEQMRLTHLEGMQRSLQEDSCAQAFIDLDDFKVINDRYGQAAGEYVLGELFRRIRHCIRRVDLVGSVGGEEIAILMSKTDEVGALTAMKNLQKNIIDEPFVIPAECLRQSCSQGAVVLDGLDGRPRVTVTIGIESLSRKNLLPDGYDIKASRTQETTDALILALINEANDLDLSSERAMKAGKAFRRDKYGAFILPDESGNYSEDVTRESIIPKNCVIPYSLFKENPAVLAALDKYLETHSGRSDPLPLR